MPDPTDILIVGGGVMGLWGALKAAEAGLSVTLIDAGDILLVKGSKGVKVSLVVDVLRKMGQAASPKEGTL